MITSQAKSLASQGNTYVNAPPPPAGAVAAEFEMLKAKASEVAVMAREIKMRIYGPEPGTESKGLLEPCILAELRTANSVLDEALSDLATIRNGL